MLYFPAPPPRTRTAYEPIYAPVRWLIGGVVVFVIYYVLLVVAALALLPLILLTWVGAIRHPFAAFGWVWTRQGIADLRRWAFEKRLTQAQRDAFIEEQARRMEVNS